MKCILDKDQILTLNALLLKGKQLQIEYDEDRDILKIYELKYKKLHKD